MSQQIDFQSPAYKRSRAAYTLECAFEYFVSLLVTDAFLSNLLKSIGISDSLTGIISSFISLSFLFQLFSVAVAHKIRNTKRFAALFHFLSQIFFMSLYLIPFLPFAKEYKSILCIVCILCAYFGNYFVTSVIYKWGNSYVDPHKRGRFGATKEIISLISGMTVTLAVGYIMDYFKASNNVEGGFIFAAVSIFIFAVCDLVCLMLIKNSIRGRDEPVETVPMREVFQNTLGNKNFRHDVVLKVLWSVAIYTTIGFLGTYRIGELAFTVGTVQIFNILGCLARAVLSRPFGKYADKRSFAKGIELGLFIALAAFVCCILTTPDTRFLIIAYTVLYQACHAGTGANMINLTYNYVDSKYFVQATAIKNSIGGVCGFLAALGAGKLLSLVQANENMIFGIHIYGQQLLAGISAVIVVVAIIYTRLVIEKQKIMVQ